ncbi:hypothetical protein D3C80_561410 [compost metagenome]
MFEQGFGDFLRLVGGYRDFKAVFTGVTGARDDAGHIVQRHFLHVHEFHLRNARPQFGQHLFGTRPLQRDQGAVIEKGDLAGVGKMRLHMGDIGILAGGVDNDEEVIATVGDHQVVEDTAVFIGEETVALAAFLEAENIHRHQLFERKCGIFIVAGLRLQDHLTHMGHVEQAGGGAGLKVFLQHAGRILHRHVVTGKRHHAGGKRKMQGMQRRDLKLGGIVQGRLQGCAKDRAGSGHDAKNAPGSRAPSVLVA